MAFFPLFIDLDGKDVLAVGAGAVGSRRIEALVESGASVTVVARSASETVKKLSEQGMVRLIESGYAEFRNREPAASYFMVLTATGEDEADRLAAEDGRRMNALVNVAGEKGESSFYFPGIAKAGKITAGIIAGGTDHRLAKEATEKVRWFLGQNYEDEKGKGITALDDNIDRSGNL